MNSKLSQGEIPMLSLDQTLTATGSFASSMA